MTTSIPVYANLFRHRKTLKLAAKLNISHVQAAGHLIALWLWAADAAPDGRLHGLTSAMLALAADWDGDPSAFIDALYATEWLEEEGNGLIFHSWSEFTGKLLHRRQLARIRQSRRRARVASTVPDPAEPTPAKSSPAQEDKDQEHLHVGAEPALRFSKGFKPALPSTVDRLERDIDVPRDVTRDMVSIPSEPAESGAAKTVTRDCPVCQTAMRQTLVRALSKISLIKQPSASS